MMTGTQLQPRTDSLAGDRILPRIAGMLRFDRRTAYEIARSRHAFDEACILTIFVAIAGMITAHASSPGAILYEVVQAYGLWFLSAALVTAFGPAFFGTPTTSLPNINATLRLFGYAQAPLLLGFAGVIDPFAGLAGAIGWLLMIVTSGFAVRELMHISWPRAIVAVLAARLVAAVPIGVSGFLLHSGDRILGAIF
jgi:hypothetical protein